MRAIDVVLEIVRKEARVPRLNFKQLNAIKFNKLFPKKVAPVRKVVTQDAAGIAVEDLLKAQERTNRLLRTPPVKIEPPPVQKVQIPKVQTPVPESLKPVEPVLKPVEPQAVKPPVSPPKWTDKMKQWYEADPLKTIALTGGGVYAGQKLLDGLFDKRGNADLKLNSYAKKFIGR